MEHILIVEDADSLREVLTSVLEGAGYKASAVASAEEALTVIKEGTPSCILSDYRLPKKNGIDLLKSTRKICPLTPFIVMTAFGTIDMAVEAMKNGANDYITKPFNPEYLCNTIKDILEHNRIVDRAGTMASHKSRRFLTQDPTTEKILYQARKAAKVNTTVLLLGESGTGKDLVARFIHDLSDRKEQPFVAINCGALPGDLLESELFGHGLGAFTGATQKRIGLFEIAKDGTLFLDEIGDMPTALQVKLLRVLQEREIRPLGSNKGIRINSRIIAATNHNIEEALKKGTIREDFYYRLAVVALTIPPLRQRPTDISLLIDYYLEYHRNRLNKSELSISPAAKQSLLSHSWPGNVRELENVIERAVLLAQTEIDTRHLGFEPKLDLDAINEVSVTLPEIANLAVRQVEIATINKALAQSCGNKTKAAKILGVSYKTLLSKVKEYQIDYSDSLTPS